jgi:hypothetical protein
MLIIVSPALAKIGCIFNKIRRVIICRTHDKSIVVPSTGSSPDEVIIGLQEHVRRNHRDNHQEADFYKCIVLSLDSSVISAESLIVSLIKEPDA